MGQKESKQKAKSSNDSKNSNRNSGDTPIAKQQTTTPPATPNEGENSHAASKNATSKKTKKSRKERKAAKAARKNVRAEKVLQEAEEIAREGVGEGELVFNSTPAQKISRDDFELLTLIGKGSFGKVMQVQKKDSGEIYAMKVLRKDAIIARKQVTHTRAEKSILQKIQHPFIVKLHYAFQTKDKLYMILDYVNGGELFFHLKREGRFSEERVRFYAAEIISAISHLHALDIVYRDLKPENILLDKRGQQCCDIDSVVVVDGDCCRARGHHRLWFIQGNRSGRRHINVLRHAGISCARGVERTRSRHGR